MKRFLSLFLIVLILVASVPTAFAALGWVCETCGDDLCPECERCVSCGACICIDTNDYSQGTQVVFEATSSESYTITVPAKLAPGDSGTVTLQGTWAVDRYVTVTASNEIDMVNSINPHDKKVLAVTFNDIGQRGNNKTSVTTTEEISVANIQNALFGTWSGLIEYNAEIETRIVDLAGTTWQMNDHISDDDNILGHGDQTGVQTANVSVDGQALASQFRNFNANNFGVGYYHYFYYNQGQTIATYVNDTVAQNFGKNGGWFLISCDVNKAFEQGEATEIDVANTAQECSAPLISFLEIENDYLRKLDIIDWLYDNAVMQ